MKDNHITASTKYDVTDQIDAILDAAGQEVERLPERIRDVRLLMIDGIAADLSREFAQGDPFEPFDRTYIVKRITAVLDAARSRARCPHNLPPP